MLSSSSVYIASYWFVAEFYRVSDFVIWYLCMYVNCHSNFSLNKKCSNTLSASAPLEQNKDDSSTTTQPKIHDKQLKQQKKLSIISGHAYNSRSHSLIDGTDGDGGEGCSRWRCCVCSIVSVRAPPKWGRQESQFSSKKKL